MKTVSLMTAAAALLLSGLANAAEIKVLSTQATEEAYKELVPQFEKVSGHKVITVFTGTLDVQKRIGAGEMHKVKHSFPQDMQPLFPEFAEAA